MQEFSVKTAIDLAMINKDIRIMTEGGWFIVNLVEYACDRQLRTLFEMCHDNHGFASPTVEEEAGYESIDENMAQDEPAATGQKPLYENTLVRALVRVLRSTREENLIRYGLQACLKLFHVDAVYELSKNGQQPILDETFEQKSIME